MNLFNLYPLGLTLLLVKMELEFQVAKRQRIGLARALYDNPDILVLDEATSALDHQTEEDLMKAVPKQLDDDKNYYYDCT